MAKPKWTKWIEEENLELIRGWARAGLSDEQIAHNMGIARSTLSDWKNKVPDISDAIKKNKEISDAYVENSMFKKACGYVATIKKPLKKKTVEYDPKTGKKIKEVEEIVYVDEQVVIPADTTAQIFWLKNRRPEEWSDRRRDTVEIESNESGVVVIAPVLEQNNV